jgi:microsomal dipeptidase-like Zn-dependent dipeptidase
VFVDTTMGHAALIRAAVDIVGATNVIAGSDFPIVDAPIRARLTEAMRTAGLSDEDQRALAAGNAQRLLGIN